MNFPFLLLSCHAVQIPCKSSHFTIEKFVWHCYVQCETNFICVLLGGKFVSRWKYKVQTNFENSKCIILKKKRPKIRLSLWKFQCKTDSGHRKNAGELPVVSGRGISILWLPCLECVKCLLEIFMCSGFMNAHTQESDVLFPRRVLPNAVS